jgi:hypothetical protein
MIIKQNRHGTVHMLRGIAWLAGWNGWPDGLVAGPEGLKGSARGESPAAPLVMEMARAVIGQEEGDTSIITPSLDLVSVR